MAHPLRVPLAALLIVALVAACTGAPEPELEPGPGPGVTPTQEPTNPASAPIRLTVEHIEVVGMDNAAILGDPGAAVDETAVTAAVDGARAALERYLNAQFIAPDSRFTAAPIDQLLAPTALAALTPDARAALGSVRLRVAETSGVPSTARAQVLLDGTTIYAVSLSFAARVLVRTEAGGHELPLDQHGSAVLRPLPEGWRVEAVDAVLDSTRVPGRPLPPEAPAEAQRAVEVGQ